MKSLFVLSLLFIAISQFSLSTAASVPAPRAVNNGRKMVCYFVNWAVYRNGNGKHDVENIDPFLCTHVIFSFTGLSLDYKIQTLDAWNDLEDNYGKGAFKRFTDLKKVNPQLKTLVAIGGWNEGSERYSRMAADPVKRATFIQSVVDLIQTFNFDGLDFDWEYPANRGGVSADKQNYISLLRELKNAFASRGWLLTAAVSAGKSTIDTAYDIPAMAMYLDQIHLMSYDFFGSWDLFTGMNSALYANPNKDQTAERVIRNTDWVVRYWISQGFPANRIIMGMPLYAQGWILQNVGNTNVYAPAPSPINPGPFTQQSGVWGYNELCEKFKNETFLWTTVRDSCYISSYAYKNNQWLSYDDRESLRTKGQYIAAMGLGGAMVWSLETDDFRGLCHGTPYPLLKSVIDGMNIPNPTVPYNPCESAIVPTEAAPTTVRTPSTTTPPNVPVNSTTTTTTTASSSSGVCKKDGLNKNPSDCGSFYNCISNGDGGWNGVLQSCAPGTVFSEAFNVCTYPNQVPGCENYIATNSQRSRV